MSKYYKIYHYSPSINAFSEPYGEQKLDSIDPAHYGEGHTLRHECKNGKNGEPKSFFYADDKPQTEITALKTTRYEVYLPCEWKLYDIKADKESLFEEAKKNLEKAPYNSLKPTDTAIDNEFERLVKANGYKGIIKDNVIALFDKLSTEKPKGLYTAYDFSTQNVLENTFPKKYSQSSTLTFNPAATPQAVQKVEEKPSFSFNV